MTPSDRARRRLRIFAVLIAAGFGALALVAWWTGRENLREGSVVATGGPPLEITKIPTTYSAVYRVEDRAGEDRVVTTEKVWVRRPFESRIEIWRGAPPGSRRVTVRQSAFGVLTSRSERAQPLNVAAPPSLATGDLRIDAPLAAALADTSILRRERREVYGRACQVYRTGGPVFAGDLTPYRAGIGELADVCIDGNGLVLEEVWMSDGRMLRRRVAVEVEADPPIDPDLLAIDVPEQPGVDRGAVERLAPAARPDLWVLDSTPQGFEQLGRYGVAISPMALPQLGGSAPDAAPVSTSDVYVRGPDLLVIDQDPSLALLTEAEGGRRQRSVELESLSDAVLIFDARMSEVRGTDGDGSVVRVFGTLPPSELLEIALGLKRGL